MMKSFETGTSNKSVQDSSSDLHGALNASGRYGQELFFWTFWTKAMIEIETNAAFDY